MTQITTATLAPARAAAVAPVDLASLLTARTRSTPERPAITFEGETVTFAEFSAQVETVAAGLAARGVQPGTRVAYLGQNHPMFLRALFAVARLGAVFVPLNYRLSGAEIAFAIDHSGSHAVFSDVAVAQLIDEHRAALPLENFIAVDGHRTGWLTVDELLAAAPAAPPEASVSPEDPALIMYTSGTTGRPKGVTLTHANLWWNNICTILALRIEAEDRSLVCAPLFHIGGLNATTLATPIQGGHLIIHRAFDPAAVFRELVESRVTTMFGIAMMCQGIAEQPGFADGDLSALRLIITGGAPVPLGLIKLFQARGIDLAQGYGLTEAAPIASFLTAEFSTSKAGSAGRPLLLCDVRIVSLDGDVVEPGVVGEIQVKGPNVTPGYWADPDATAAAFDGDWLKTGDAGYCDDEGFLFITDRIKDMIISGGENIYPAEVEGVLFDHPSVAEVTVIGREDPTWGQRVCAVVSLKPGKQVTLDELRDFAGTRIGRYKLPTVMETVEALPRNAAGKVLKTALREQFK
ncbi:acyl-CoA synthetase [Gordonia paraffinivorans]|uniref:acyl-CoA synthetase n=1 Tax=Gordonia paraffinivorans TaxID=175628 RepID=UPI001C930E65|nr:long-chain fatty acid--CoA ligase [Gordonia paraffinivorans]MBY4573364.1 acyl-CoA synthetase [Gordonia paraffinivorans]